MAKNKKPLELVKDVETSLRNYRRPFEKPQTDEEKAYYGDIWVNTSEYRPVENHIFRIVEGEVATITDSFPSVKAEAKDPDKKPQAQNLSKAIEYVNEKQNLQGMLPVVVRNSLKGGPGYIHEYYDPNADNGEGLIKRESLHWRDVLLDGSVSVIEDSNKAQFRVRRSKEWLKLSYPKFKKEIEKAKAEDTIGEDSEGRGLETRDTGSGARNKRSIPPRYKDEDTLTLCYTYIKDFSLAKIPEEETSAELEQENAKLSASEAPNLTKWQDHKAHIEFHIQERGSLLENIGLPPEASFQEAAQLIDQILQESPESGADVLLFQIKVLENHIEEHAILLEENPDSAKMKYPDGWRVLETLGKTVLHDGKSRYNTEDGGHGEIPITPFYANKDETIYGFSDVKNILDSQRMQVVMAYKEYKGLQLTANPQIIYDNETNLTDKDITNEDGAKYKIPQGSNIRYMEMGQVSEQVVRFKNERAIVMQDIAGARDLSDSSVFRGQLSEATVERLQIQSVGRQRLKQRQNQFYSLARMGKITAGNIMQFWSTEKTIGVDNSQGFDAAIIFTPVEMQDLEFDIKIDQGSAAGTDKNSYNALLFNLLKLGQINVSQFFKLASDLPKSNEAVEMIGIDQQKDQAIQQLQEELVFMKARFDPNSLTEDEAKFVEEAANQAGVDNDQPV